MSRTVLLRGNYTCLFISYVKPHKPVVRDTISRWLKSIMIRTGLEITNSTDLYGLF